MARLGCGFYFHQFFEWNKGPTSEGCWVQPQASIPHSWLLHYECLLCRKQGNFRSKKFDSLLNRQIRHQYTPMLLSVPNSVIKQGSSYLIELWILPKSEQTLTKKSEDHDWYYDWAAASNCSARCFIAKVWCACKLVLTLKHSRESLFSHIW